MSQVYSTEPQASGSVVFETTHGPLSVHLWCKECPHTTRYFLQLCLDGFYDQLIFHRIVPGFLIQTGDPHYRQPKDSSSNETKDDDTSVLPFRKLPPKPYVQQHRAVEALQRRGYEVNSRIRFNHRGQLAMALGINDDPDDPDKSFARLQPQFFITLEEAPHLDGQHVCFGGVAGPTIFNALRIGQTELEDGPNSFRPRILAEAPRILRTKILTVDLPPALPALAPTQDRALMPWTIDPGNAKDTQAKSKRKKKNRKGVKNVNLLSFGEEVDEEEDGEKGEKDKSARQSSKKILSSHDVSTSKSMSKEPTKIEETPNDRDGASTEHPTAETTKQESTTTASAIGNDHHDISSIPRAPEFTSRTDRLARQDEATSNNRSTPTIQKPEKPKKKKLSLVEARRARFAQKNSNRSNKGAAAKQQREESTMARFKAFQQKLTGTASTEPAPEAYHGQVLEPDDGDSSGWLRTKFHCKKHMDHDAKSGGRHTASGGADGRNADEYEVVEERGSATHRKPSKRRRR